MCTVVDTRKRWRVQFPCSRHARKGIYFFPIEIILEHVEKTRSKLARENSDWNSVLKYQTSSQRPISWIWNVGNKWIQCNCLKSRILGVIKWNSRFISRRKIFWYLRVAESENALESVKCGRSYPQPRKPENGWAHFFKWRLNLSDLIFNHPDFKRLDFKHSYFKLLKI